MAATLYRPAIVLAALACTALAGAPASSEDRNLPHTRPAGKLELVATFDGPMPTGVTVSRSGRIFVCFPRWGDKVEYTVAELKKGKTAAYPNAEFNRHDPNKPGDCLVSVQSVVVDPRDRLWLLDTGSIEMGPTVPNGPKLVCVDLEKDRVVKTIRFPRDVALPATYLNDVRFDLRKGTAGIAYITDSSTQGANGIIVVDLDSGKSWRRLRGHGSTLPEMTFQPFVEGRPLMNRPEKGKPSRLSIGADGIAISSDGKRLYYCPLASRRLYSVATAALLDRKMSDSTGEMTVIDHGEKGASDGLESDAEGRLYLTNYEQNAVLRRRVDGTLEPLVADDRLLWPDTLSLAADGYLYVTANQLHRQARFHGGKDLRRKPYSLFRIRVAAKPVALK
jgi:sugar lactone lactonase YvrE